jgi:hypothetical protein
MWTFNKDEFLAIFPEFSAMADAQINFYADEAVAMVNLSRFGIAENRFNLYYFKLIAHLLALAKRGSNGGIGAITSASQGSVSVGFQGAFQNNGSFFNQTVYGSNFWQLLRPLLSPRLIRGA